MIDWLLGSPIRNTQLEGEQAYRYGSFNHSQDSSAGKVGGQYTEITGYAVSLLSYLYRRRQEARFLRAAQSAAAFLLRIQHTTGAFPDLENPLPGNAAAGPLYSFDTAMCVHGLLDLYSLHPDGAHLEAAMRAGEWLLSMQRRDGSFAAAENEAGRFNPGNFFGDGSCIHAKNAAALAKLAAAGSGDAYSDAAYATSRYVMTMQSDSGFFWATPSREFVFTHAHCYACEGLLVTGVLLKDLGITRAAHRGIEWLRDVQNSDGSVYQMYEDRRSARGRMVNAVNRPKVADATAQASRLFSLYPDELYEHAGRAAQFLAEQMQDAGGGLFYTRGRLRRVDTLYTWATLFAVQAFEMITDRPSPRDLF